MPRDASIYARKGSPYYRCSYWSPTKLKRVHETTAFRVDDPNGRRHALRFAQDKSEEAAATRGIAKAEAWGSWVESFLRMRYAEGSRTLERYLGAWDWLREFLDVHKLHVPAAIHYKDVLAFVTWRMKFKKHSGRPISRNTALCDVRVWSVIMREAVRREFCQGNPCERLGIKKVPTKERPEYTREEIAIYRKAVRDRESHLPLPQRWMSISFEIALHQSTRLRATSIPLDRIDVDRRELTWQGKSRNGEVRLVTKRLHDALVPLIVALKKAGATHTCILPRMAAKELWQLRQEIGLGHVTFHSTRNTVVTELARQGVTEQQAMAYVDHSDRIVHRLYSRVKAQDLQVAVKALDFGPVGLELRPAAGRASRQTRGVRRAI